MTDQEIRQTVRDIVHYFRDHTRPEPQEIREVGRSILRRLCNQQIEALQLLGGCPGWTSDSLERVLCTAAELELGVIAKLALEVFEREMKMHATPPGLPDLPPTEVNP